jgi:hypothetical protein
LAIIVAMCGVVGRVDAAMWPFGKSSVEVVAPSTSPTSPTDPSPTTPTTGEASDARAPTTRETEATGKKTTSGRRKKSPKAALKEPVVEEFDPMDPDAFSTYDSTQDLGEGEAAIGGLHEAIDDDDMEELEELLTWKPNLREKCQKLGETRHFVPITKAAYMGNARAMDLLIDYGANVNEIDSLGYSVLMRSVLSKCLECVKILVEAGAVINYVQKSVYMDMGLTAMTLSELMGLDEINAILRSAGGDARESGAEKRRRMQQERNDDFKEFVKNSDLDNGDIDEVLGMTNLKVKNIKDADVVVSVGGENATMKSSETKDYDKVAETLRKAKESKEKASDSPETTACDSETGDEGSCAFDATSAVKDEL